MSGSTIFVCSILALLFVLSIVAEVLARSKRLKGKVGEELIEGILEKLNKKVYGKILKNVYIPKNESESSEIDVVYITTKGIFVIESKNLSGWIFGKEKDQYWTSSLPAGKGKSIKNKFYNPIKQNER